MIPLVDLGAQFKGLKAEMMAKIEEVLESRSYIQGEFVAELESKFTAMHGANFGSGCSNGTTALFLALSGLDIGPGDEVVTVSHSFIATAEAISHVGAQPVFVDIQRDTYCMDPRALEAAITPRTKAIMPVHLYGNPCDMDAIMTLAQQRGLAVIEDAAQAHLATYGDRFVGTFGQAAAFSFYPGKNLGAYGDAGFVFAQTKEQEMRVRKLLDHGRMSKYEHDMVGYNHRMDGIQAGILLVKLKYLEQWTERRRSLAALYDRLLSNAGFELIHPTPKGRPVYHLYVVQVANRREVMDYLKAKGITSSIHYPVPIHLQPAYSELGYKRGHFPVTEAVAERIVSLPLYPELREEQVEFIAAEFIKVARP